MKYLLFFVLISLISVQACKQSQTSSPPESESSNQSTESQSTSTPKNEQDVDLDEDCFIPGLVILAADNGKFGLLRVGNKNTEPQHRYILPYKGSDNQLEIYDEVIFKSGTVSETGELNGFVYAVDVQKIEGDYNECPNYKNPGKYSLDVHMALNHDHEDGGPDHKPGHIINLDNPTLVSFCYQNKIVIFKEMLVLFYDDRGGEMDKDTILVPHTESQIKSPLYLKANFAKSRNAEEFRYLDNNGDVRKSPVYKTVSYFHDHATEYEHDLTLKDSDRDCD